jgi:aminotransferase
MGEMLKVHDATAICAPTVSQHAALAALTGPQDCVEQMCAALEKRRSLTMDRMAALAPAFTCVPPRGAFYVMARYSCTPEPSPEVARRILEEARVITVPGASFGPAGENHLRLSFGADEAELTECFDRLQRWAERQ